MEPFDWKTRYAQKLCSAEEAVQRLASGRRVLIGSNAAAPQRLAAAMVSDRLGLLDMEVVHLLTLGKAPYVAPELKGRFRHLAFFIGENVREAVQDGRADFIPVFLSEIPRLIRSRQIRIDAALIQVSPPDRHGFVSLGVSVDVVRAAVDSAPLILAEVNPRMPRTLGDSFLPVDRIDRLVEVDEPVLERTPSPLDPVARAIGDQLAALIPDGATLQTGIGAIPDAVMAALVHHHDLGVHTEMLSDGVMDLAEAGVITGRKKSILPGKLVTSFVMGSRALYDWVDENPAVEMRPSEYTNDPQVIARNEKMVAINSAIAVDLTGQVAADSIHGRFYSGIGGQVDFIRGAARSPGGKAVIALRSTANGGKVSRIQPMLEPGAGVVTSRGDVHSVVTEYGVAELWGRSVRERALALTSIAHPDFRGELLAAAKQRRYVFLDQDVPRAVYPWSETRSERLASGARIRMRPVRITDERLLQEFLYALSDESIYRRFLLHKRSHPREELQALVAVDFEKAVAMVAEDSSTDEIIGVIRYDVDRATNLADIAFIVRDDWQGKGVGTAMMRRMIEVGQARGLLGFTADVLITNTPALALFSEAGLHVQAQRVGEQMHLIARFAPLPCD